MDLYLTPYTNINSKWITNFNVKPKPIRLTEENKGESFCDLGLGKAFLYSQKVQSLKEQTDKFDFIKITSFGSLKKVVKTIKES